MPRAPTPKKDKTVTPTPKKDYDSNTFLCLKTMTMKRFIGFKSTYPKTCMLSNFYQTPVRVEIDRLDCLYKFVPDYMKGKVFETVSSEHMWQLLTVLMKTNKKEDQEKVIELFKPEGKLSQWETLGLITGKKVPNWNDKTRPIGLVAKNFVKMDKKDALKKFGVSNEKAAFSGGETPLEKKKKRCEMGALWKKILLSKFQENKKAGDFLRSTGKELLVEVQRWTGEASEAEEKVFWGGFIPRQDPVYQHEMLGKNVMGKYLMVTRDRYL